MEPPSVFHSDMARAPWYLNDSHASAARSCVILCSRQAAVICAALAVGGLAHTAPPNPRAELLQEARDKTHVYERQEEDPGTQTVRVWGDTAIVTARLWVKGVNGGKPFDRHLWFSDVYVRAPTGWHYVFGQASLHLPEESNKS
jgi:Domain of unknown function (DUF4440)